MASRPQLFTREQLTSMKRVDIQRICKDYGVRANMKTDALIEVCHPCQSILHYSLTYFNSFFLTPSSTCDYYVVDFFRPYFNSQTPARTCRHWSDDHLLSHSMLYNLDAYRLALQAGSLHYALEVLLVPARPTLSQAQAVMGLRTLCGLTNPKPLNLNSVSEDPLPQAALVTAKVHVPQA